MSESHVTFDTWERDSLVKFAIEASKRMAQLERELGDLREHCTMVEEDRIALLRQWRELVVKRHA